MNSGEKRVCAISLPALACAGRKCGDDIFHSSQRYPAAGKGSAGRVRFFGSGTNAEKDRSSGNWRYAVVPGKQNGNSGTDQ
jgi:hypothetical protein